MNYDMQGECSYHWCDAMMEWPRHAKTHVNTQTHTKKNNPIRSVFVEQTLAKLCIHPVEKGQKSLTKCKMIIIIIWYRLSARASRINLEWKILRMRFDQLNELHPLGTRFANKSNLELDSIACTDQYELASLENLSTYCLRYSQFNSKWTTTLPDSHRQDKYEPLERTQIVNNSFCGRNKFSDDVAKCKLKINVASAKMVYVCLCVWWWNLYYFIHFISFYIVPSSATCLRKQKKKESELHCAVATIRYL